ncbi:ATP-binding protein [Streptomyces aurantiacus]|uniref:ATP-binding protein n=1 Tax=Streptomyces aurantiacus TaxID=47760 RepID=A0A7G1NT27_9ACTN|nr:ATP-binding protein [Streptomyces aurantiacus]BCL26443.1 ATP-binding protein [Streptomyces aurantiacus]
MNQESVAATREPLAHTGHFSFSSLFTTTEYGAHQVRHEAERWLAEHLPLVGPSGGEDADMDAASLLIAELTANAALHGRVRGRDARLDLTLGAMSLLIEVTDARGDRLPGRPPATAADGESGRGLLLVESLADDWGARSHHPGGKTVWATIGL